MTLVAERGWSWDDSLHEVTHIRSEMASLLQPRPRQLKPPPLGGKGDSWIRPNRVAPYGKGDGKYQKGDGKKGKKGGKGQRVAWVTDINQGGHNVTNFACGFRQTNVQWILADSNTYAHTPPETAKHVGKIMGLLQHESTAH